MRRKILDLRQTIRRRIHDATRGERDKQSSLDLHRAKNTVSKDTILGLNCSGFNSSCAFVRDGKVLFAVEEERMIRQKRTRLFPKSGIQYGFKKLELELEDLECIAIGWNPVVNLESYNGAHANNLRFLGELFCSAPLNLMSLQDRESGLHSSQCPH